MVHPLPVLRTRLAVSAALLLGFAAVLSPARAEPGDELVVDAVRSAYVDVELTQDTALQSPDAVEIRGGGRYTSVLVMPLDPARGRPAVSAGATVLREVTPKVVPEGFGDLPAGRYRVVVLTDRPVRWVLRLDDGSAGMRVRATRPVTATYAVGRTQVTATGASSAQVRLVGAVPAGASARLVASLAGTRADQVRLCAVEPGGRCAGQVLPISAPAGLDYPNVEAPSTGDQLPSRSESPTRTTRDAVLTVDGVRSGTTTLVLASLAFRAT